MVLLKPSKMNWVPVILSLKTSIISSIVVFFLGTFLAIKILKVEKFRGLFDAILTLPLVLPPTVVGLYLLIFLGRNGLGRYLSKYDIDIVFTQTANIIAQSLVSLPIMYRIALGAFEQIDKDLIDCARTLGASEREIFWKISLPLVKPSLASGFILSFARCIGEFGASIMVAGNIPSRTQTLSTAIYSAIQAGNKPLAVKWSLTIIFINFTSMLVLNLWMSLNRRRRA